MANSYGGKAIPLSPEEIRQRLSYDPATGEFIHLSGKLKGKVAGTVRSNGYRQLSIDGSLYMAHRVAFVWMDIPICHPLEVDHINKNPKDNRWCNLRLASSSQNKANRSRNKAKQTAFKGVYRVAGYDNRYTARLKVGKVIKHLGCFSTQEEAAQVYLKEAIKHFGEFASL